jgi:hypothetical protein
VAIGDLGVVERWLSAVNRGDSADVLSLTSDDIEIVGPRGVGRGKELLSQWLARAGFRSVALRWFFGGGGHVVVEQAAEWTQPDGTLSRARVASAFDVRAQVVSRFQRFESVEGALGPSGLCSADEVLTRLASPPDPHAERRRE